MPFAGVSIVSNGKSSGSASAMVCRAAGGYHLLVVDGYSRVKDTPNIKSFRSRPFRVGGFWWIILYSPNGERPKDDGYVSVTLALDLDQEISRRVKVNFEFTFVEQVEEQRSARVRAGEVLALKAGTSCDHHRWMERGYHIKWKRIVPSRLASSGEFDKSEHLRDDGFIIRCDIFVIHATEDTERHPPAEEVPSSKILHQFRELLRTQLGTDVMFEVGGETFAAHRCVLAARSSVFRAQLFGPMIEGTTTATAINIKDMEANVFRALLTFIYTDSMPKMEIDNMDEDKLEEHEGDTEDDDESEEEDEDVDAGEGEQVTSWLQNVLVAADRFDLAKLKLLCEDQLSEHIDMDSVMTILALAEQHHCCWLKEECLHFLQIMPKLRLHKLMETKGWDHIVETYPAAVVNQLIFKLASKC